jgi:phage-related protein
MSDTTYSRRQEGPAKPLIWLHGKVRTPPFSSEARVEAGVLIRLLQEGVGLSLPHSRPMPRIGRGCHEPRIQDQNRTWRIVYFVDSLSVVILAVFAKTTGQTPEAVIDVCKTRLRRFKVDSREDMQ